MVIAVATGLLAACSPANRSAPAVVAAAQPNQAIEDLGEAFVTAGRADGLSVAIIEHGSVRFLNFGTISRTTARRPDKDTVYEIGSITKVFASLLLAQAVTEGRVSLQDDIRRYLPGDYPNLERDGVPIRLAHLAETTSGLPDNIPDLAPFIRAGGADRAPFLIAERWKTFSNRELLAELRTVTLLDRPGTTSRHSNVAASLLGIILESVYQQPFETLVARYIEVPSGMGSGSGSGSPGPRQPAPGFNSSGVAMPALDSRYILSAGGLRYSSADMARFVEAQLRAGNPAISLSQQPIGRGDNAALGFNWRIARSRDGQRVLRASGGTFGSSSYVEIRPEAGYGLVLLTNRSGAEAQLYTLAEQTWLRTRPAR